MIQRIQTLWLFIASACAGLSFKFAFYSGIKTGKDNLPIFEDLTASSNLLIMVFTAVLVIGCIAIIFFYKERKNQMLYTVIAIIISIINLVIYFSQLKKFTSGTVSLAAVFTFAIPMFLALALRGIWKDQKLVKSLDRLR